MFVTRKSYVLLMLAILFLGSCHQESQNWQIAAPLQSDSFTEGDSADSIFLVQIRTQPSPLRMAKNQAARTSGRQSLEDALIQVGVHDPISRLIREYDQCFSGYAVALKPEEAALLSGLPSVVSVEADQAFVLPDHRVRVQTHLRSQEKSWGFERLQVPQHDCGSSTVWVMDTGVDLDHPDLNVDCSRSVSVLPWYFYERSAEDLNGHGTHVAGIIAAKDNAIGSCGIASGARIVAVKALNRRGVSRTSILLDGLNYIAEHAAPGDVVNLSFGGGDSPMLDFAVESLADLGLKIAIAAGNSGQSVERISPAQVNHSNIFTVSAIDSNDRIAFFSNFGTPVDVGAPGVDIPSTYKEGQYAAISGTSMAAPHVAGLLLLEQQGYELVTDGVVRFDPDGFPDKILIAK